MIKTKLIFLLSLLSLVMGFLTINLILPNWDYVCYIIIFMICGYVISRYCDDKYFMHGVLVGLIGSVWITAIHVLFYKNYIIKHPAEEEMLKNMWNHEEHARTMMLFFKPAVGIIYALLQGVFAYFASLLTEVPEPPDHG